MPEKALIPVKILWGKNMKWHLWLLRLALLANPVLLVTLQLSRLKPGWQQEGWRILPLLALIFITGFLAILSVLPLGKKWLAIYQQRTTQNRLVAWAAILIIFLVYGVAAANTIQPVVDNNAEILRILGGLNALILLGLYQRERSPLAISKLNGGVIARHDKKMMLAILLISILMSVWQFMDSAPWIMDDSSSYYGISRQILEGEFTPEGDFTGLYAASPFSYSYALVIAISRLFADHILSIIVFQHALRAVLAAAAFWMLRDIFYPLAVITGFLLALATPTLHFAHLLLADSLYTSLLLWFTLLACHVLCKSSEISWMTLLLTGIAGGLVAWMRPVGALVVIGLLLLLLLRRFWRQMIPLGIGFVFIMVIAAGGRWLLDGHFSPSPPQGDLYYYVPLLHQDLYRPENGTLSAELLRGCELGQLDYRSLLYLCQYHYLAETGNSISLLSVYLEAIRAQPMKFLYAMYSEARIFIGGYSDPWLPQYIPLESHVPAAPDTPPQICGAAQCIYRPDQVVVWAAEHFNQEYARYATVYMTEANPPQNRLYGLYSRIFLLVIQPYLLTGQHSTAFWAAIVLLYFVWIETREKYSLRWLLIFNVFLIAYHAAVTAFANITTYRYIYVLTPQFIMLAGLFYWLMWVGIHHQRESSV